MKKRRGDLLDVRVLADAPLAGAEVAGTAGSLLERSSETEAAVVGSGAGRGGESSMVTRLLTCSLPVEKDGVEKGGAEKALGNRSSADSPSHVKTLHDAGSPEARGLRFAGVEEQLEDRDACGEAIPSPGQKVFYPHELPKLSTPHARLGALDDRPRNTFRARSDPKN